MQTCCLHPCFGVNCATFLHTLTSYISMHECYSDSVLYRKTSQTGLLPLVLYQKRQPMPYVYCIHILWIIEQQLIMYFNL
ncbi:hypothetical protein ACOSP7_005912 [Xanthoceras sorbifolium]